MDVQIIPLLTMAAFLVMSWILMFELRYYALKYRRENDRLQRQTIVLLNTLNEVLRIHDDAMNIVEHYAVDDVATAKQARELRNRMLELEGPLDVN